MQVTRYMYYVACPSRPLIRVPKQLQLRRRGQRDRQKNTNGLLGKTTILQMRHTLLWHNCDVKISYATYKAWTQDGKFAFFSLNVGV